MNKAAGAAPILIAATVHDRIRVAHYPPYHQEAYRLLFRHDDPAFMHDPSPAYSLRKSLFTEASRRSQEGRS